MVAVKAITHINLLVSDVRRAQAFYQRVFGLEEMFAPGPALVFLKIPGTTDVIALQESPDAAGTNTMEHFGFQLVDDAQREKAVDEVVQAGGSFVERGTHGGSPYVYVRDPDGNLIEL